MVAFVLCFSFPALAAMPTLVTGLELQAGAGPQVLRIALFRKPESLRTFLLQDPARLVLDIAPARLGGGTRHLPADHDLIHGVRTGQFNAQTVRVVLDLKQGVTHRAEFHPQTQDRDPAIVVSLFPDAPTLPAAPTQGPATPSARPATLPALSA